MMIEKNQTIIPLHYFFDEEILRREKQQLFSPHWLFACFLSDVPQHEDYLTLEFLGTSIVVYNFSGQLRAFQNVCVHRFSIICLHERGNGLLQCPYHGWTYNEVGIPYAIPDKKNFCMEQVSQLRLKQFDLAIIGEFVFIKLAETKCPIDDFFDATTHDLLITIGAALGEKIDKNSMLIQANWKIIVENTLEEYHVRQVHSDSLNQVEIKKSSFSFSDYHSSALMEFGTKINKSKKLEAIYMARSWHVEDYFHLHIFPNLTIASAFGTTISVQNIVPITPYQTNFTSYVFAAKLSQSNHALVKAFNQNAVEFNRKVFLEDQLICEAVQQGIQQTEQKAAPLSCQEERVWFFEKNYITYMR
jgi:phenylpropionate dioxygenase-like ring-hydroxylating dioxygenase large terminal subunit